VIPAVNTRPLAGLLLLLVLVADPAGAARLSPCQGQFGPERGAAYRFELTTEGLSIDEATQLTLARASRALYDSWGELLSATPPFAVEVRLQLVSKRSEFLALQREIAPELHSVSGFYSTERNLAVVHFPGGDEIQARRSAIHEVSHLLTTAQVGVAPQWLAEGLAEYYEMISVLDDGTAQVGPNERHLSYLATAELPPLVTFFSLPAARWHEPGAKAYYSLAWSLVYFMMETAAGRGALGLVLQQGSTHSCLPWSASAFLHQAWPGGLLDFERQWREWLARGEFALK
jgi:hypothetical protein